jgi:hypothetical protein
VAALPPAEAQAAPAAVELPEAPPCCRNASASSRCEGPDGDDESRGPYPIDQQFGPYVLETCLGSVAFKSVYRARRVSAGAGETLVALGFPHQQDPWCGSRAVRSAAPAASIPERIRLPAVRSAIRPRSPSASGRSLRDLSIEGLTVSGGEPLQQPEALLDLLARVRTAGLSTLLFSGYTLGEIENQSVGRAVLDVVDVLVAGRYVQSRHLGQMLLGSANQHIHVLTSRYTLRDLAVVPRCEVVLHEDGSFTLSGIDPLKCSTIAENAWSSRRCDSRAARPSAFAANSVVARQRRPADEPAPRVLAARMNALPGHSCKYGCPSAAGACALRPDRARTRRVVTYGTMSEN